MRDDRSRARTVTLGPCDQGQVRNTPRRTPLLCGGWHRERRPPSTGDSSRPATYGELRDRNRLLFAVAALNAALVAVFTGPAVVDRRTLLERSVRMSISSLAARMQYVDVIGHKICKCPPRKLDYPVTIRQ